MLVLGHWFAVKWAFCKLKFLRDFGAMKTIRMSSRIANYARKFVYRHLLLLRFKIRKADLAIFYRGKFGKISAMPSVNEIVQLTYINLDSRPDRLIQIQEEIAYLGMRNSTRYSANQNKIGALGCSLSHRNVLQQMNRESDKSVFMICEDDLIFLSNPGYIHGLILEFIDSPDADVLCLANLVKDKPRPFSKNLLKTENTQTTACYVFKKHMTSALLASAERSVQMLTE